MKRREALQAEAHRAAKIWTQLSDCATATILTKCLHTVVQVTHEIKQDRIMPGKQLAFTEVAGS